jgi:hypothetical protein
LAVVVAGTPAGRATVGMLEDELEDAPTAAAAGAAVGAGGGTVAAAGAAAVSAWLTPP